MWQVLAAWFGTGWLTVVVVAGWLTVVVVAGWLSVVVVVFPSGPL